MNIIDIYNKELPNIKESISSNSKKINNIDIIKYSLNDFADNKKKAGTINELLIAGTLSKLGYDINVPDDNNRDYDIIVSKDGKHNYLECKLDNTAHIYSNFYFEYWNYTFNRPTGINNTNLNTLYAHTYFNNDDKRYYFLSGKRMIFVEAIKTILSKEPNSIRKYEHTYISYNGLVGDSAYIVKQDTFMKYFKGFNVPLLPVYRWK